VPPLAASLAAGRVDPIRAAGVAFLAVFAVVAPVRRDASTRGSNTGHVALLGLMTPSTPRSA
jgi:hypothetical protein